jgi:hypothetical protein
MSKSFNILVCDINIVKGGHYISHSQYILDHVEQLESENPNLRFTFLYNKNAVDLLKFSDHTKDRAHYLEVDESPGRGLKPRNDLVKKIRAFCKEHKVDHMIFMDFDKYQLSFFLTRFPCTISGILFRPHHRVLVSNEGLKKYISSRLVRIKKKMADKMLINNRNISTVFIFNDMEGVDILNSIFKTRQFKYLADPVYTYASSGSLESLNVFRPSTYKYLIFGALDERKNITNILKAYDAASLDFDSEILLIGISKPPYLQYLNELISSCPSINNKHKKVFIRSEFVRDDEMDYYFSVSDVCLLIYKDFFGSSGLLGRAALHHKKVIGANTGVLGELIPQYNLGITTDPYSIEKITKSMSDIHDYALDHAKCQAFYEQHSPQAFLKQLVTVK